MKNYKDQIVWITGASSGIGEALAYEFAKRGAKLVLSARREAALEAVKARCERPNEHVVLPMDMLDISTFEDKTAAVVKHFGQIDVLINNAGVSQRSLVKDTTMAVNRQLMELDFFAPVALTKIVLPYMMARKTGHLVAVSSVIGLAATPYRSAYAAAKHAMVGFYDALRAEVHADGLQVSLLCPGAVRTEVSRSALTADGTPHGKMDAIQDAGMSAQDFASKAVNALARGEGRIVIAGKEKLLVYIGRLSPALQAWVVRRIKVT